MKHDPFTASLKHIVFPFDYMAEYGRYPIAIHSAVEKR
jgi:hypothetical protein